MYKIIDNFLTKEEFEDIQCKILNPNFDWHLSPQVTDIFEEDQFSIQASYYFVHEFFRAGSYHIDPEVKIFSPILNKIQCKSLIRIKANLYPSTESIFHHKDHIDYDYSHRGAIFYLNSNDGYTILENDIEIESIENRLLLFDPNKIHRSTTCTNSKCRINVNLNFF